MARKKDPNTYPPGLDATKVQRIIAHYDRQTDAESAEEIATAPAAEPTVWVSVPEDLVPEVRRLIARHKRTA